jgi:hypothetical protein
MTTEISNKTSNNLRTAHQGRQTFTLTKWTGEHKNDILVYFKSTILNLL